MRAPAAIPSVLLLLALGAGAASAAPGDPFGGDDGGCVPRSSDLKRCSERAAKAYSLLESALVKCHASQAAARFSSVIDGNPKAFDEEACEAAARGRFDDTLAGLDAGGRCGGNSILFTAAEAADSVQAALDARGSDLYCDATSGTAIDPGGDDAGSIPATRDALTCTRRLGSALGKLAKTVVRCHQSAAAAAFGGAAFDDEACEQAAVAKYDSLAASLAAKGTCPPCVDAALLRDDATARLDAGNASLYPCPDPVLHAGTPSLDRPTLMALGLRLPVTGDEDRDATVSLRYRETGAPSWTEGMALLRVKPETVPSGGSAAVEEFAGSILDLRPATGYEIELHAVDADGPVDETRTLTATTRAVPADPESPHQVDVSDAAALHAALAAAAPGDVITIADGVHHGTFVLDAGGTAANPIVIRGTSRDGTVLDGDACECNVLEVYGSFVHVENLTLRHATRALRFQTAGAEGNVVRRVHTADTRLGIATREGQFDFYIADNLLEGRLSWPQVYTDDGGAFANEDGINVQGDGHVVAHNDLVGFGDALKTEVVGARAVDFYGNEVRSAYDNGLELDISSGNVRAWRNRFTNTFMALSFQPVYGGPAYAIRNIVVNNPGGQMKFNGLGSGDGPSGVLAWHNTFVSPGIALQEFTSAASHNFEVRGNLFVGPEVLAGTRTVDWTAPIVDGVFDGDGFFPDGGFRFNFPPTGLTSWSDFAALQASGIETAGVLLAQPVFASGLVAPASYTTALSPADVTLDASSNAVDAGTEIPGVTNGYQGSAPDLGALERGCPLPVYGIRPAGVDESVEPTGCE